MKHIEEHPEFIQPESRKNEMVNNFLKPGLQDLCVSRTSFTWGIPVDFDPGHIVYVWMDALSNYITGLGYDVGGNNDDLYEKFWPADLHLIGKDILRFHTIYWPIMLMALDIPLPKQIFGHPWLSQGDGKMSKSKGNVLYADDLVDEFGVDAVRYFVLHEMPFENDGVVTWELMVERMNSDLANTLGNLVNRTISMSNKYFDGVVKDAGVSEPVDDELKAVINAAPGKVTEKMDKLRVADAITEIFTLFKRCNKYIDETMPWALAKEEEKKRSETILANMRANELRRLSLMDNSLSAVRFTIADKSGENARSVEICRRYAAKFQQMKQDNRGLLLFGGVGTGKTYTAACIANELLAQGVSVVMTSLVKLIENGISDLCSRLSAIDLLILDDLGAERSTDYALEQVYNIVDSRYRAGLPVIYTTNLTLEELKNPADMRYARIYDRVLEKCFPVEFRGVSRRKHGARQGFDDMMALLGVDDTT